MNGGGEAVTSAEKITNNISFTLVSRLAMVITPIVLGVFAWVIADFVTVGREQVAALGERQDQQDVRIGALETRLTTMEADRNVRIVKSAEAQAALLDHLKTIDEDISDLTIAVTKITTKIDDWRTLPSTVR